MGIERLRALAELQHGLVSRAQCRSAGFDAAACRALFRRGDWEPLSPRVLRLVGSPQTAQSSVMATVLDAGDEAVASHRTAAALWRLPGFSLATPEVSLLHDTDHNRRTVGRVHHPRSLPSHHRTVIEGVPVTTPARTLFDLAGVLHPARTARAVDNALAESPALLRVLHRMLPELAERGRNGITVMREILDERPLGYVPPASGLEARAIRILNEAGIPVRRQVDLGDDAWIGRVDLLVEGTNLVIEIDSMRHHSSLLDRRRDSVRDARLRAAGYEVLRIAAEDVWNARETVVARVRSVLVGKTRNGACDLPTRTGVGGN